MKSTPKQRAAKAWTFMVYMAGDNNLEPEGVQDIAEMKRVGSTEDVNVVAQFDRPAGATRYFLRSGTTAKADALRAIGKLDTGDPAALVDFVRWAAAAYPARNHALVLWNHGQGWDDTDIFAGQRSLRPKRIRRAFFRSSIEQAARLTRKATPEAKAILIDDGAKDFLDNVELKKAVAAIRKVLGGNLGLLGMDACLMSMAEVGFQCRDGVAFTVGSEETEPGEGWPYDKILKQLARDPSIGPDALGKVVVDEYLASYRRGGAAVTQSLCALASADGLAGAVKALGAALHGALRDDGARLALVDIRNRVRDFEVRENVDLLDLCALLEGSSAMPDDVKAAAANVRAVTGYVVHSGFVGDGMKGASGVAIYFPTVSVSPLYAKLDWEKATGWGEFLQAYVTATRSR